MAKFKVDMSNVDERVLVPEDDYICKVSKIELKRSENSGGQYLNWVLVIGAGPYKGNKLYHITSLKPEALFNLRNTIIACGVEVPRSVMSIDTDKFIGKIVGASVVHEEYKGKPTAKIGDLWRAAKGPNGWGRADQIAAKKVTEEVPEEEEVADTEEDIDTTIADDVEEIDV